MLYTGKDFIIIDFEGDNTRTIGERRVKQSPLRDVASMVRSFDAAAQSVPSRRDRRPRAISGNDPTRGPAGSRALAHAWYDHVARQFVQTYMQAIQATGLLPRTADGSHNLLDLLLLDKAFAQIDAALTERVEWVAIPLRGAVRLLAHQLADPAGPGAA